MNVMRVHGDGAFVLLIAGTGSAVLALDDTGPCLDPPQMSGATDVRCDTHTHLRPLLAWADEAHCWVSVDGAAGSCDASLFALAVSIASRLACLIAACNA